MICEDKSSNRVIKEQRMPRSEGFPNLWKSAKRDSKPLFTASRGSARNVNLQSVSLAGQANTSLPRKLHRSSLTLKNVEEK